MSKKLFGSLLFQSDERNKSWAFVFSFGLKEIISQKFDFVWNVNSQLIKVFEEEHFLCYSSENHNSQLPGVH